MAYGDRLKRNEDRRMTLEDRLRSLLEHSPNAYVFRQRCEGYMIVIQRMPDGSIVASYTDDRDGQVVIDVTQAPFDRLLLFS